MENIYKNIIEALIFSSDEPLTNAEIIKAIKGIDGEDAEITAEDINSAIDLLNQEYEATSRAVKIVKIAGGYLFATREEFAKYIGYLSSEKTKRRLSQAALETLAIIAYKQPITKPELESIRGVNSDYILATLLDKKLITISGRAETIGRPLLYTTTEEFLKYFGLNSLSDLPKPREIEEIMQDEDFIEQRNKIMMNAVEETLEKESENEENSDETE
ncbi:MAG: SMC-Scp complex subunit ScpB [Ignavibacterium album]|uniref:SMC-Scp complex subunit ScpB n=1 Tax=Ignavibacterium album TaxID=591197 RepID=UPI0026EC524C|nr:SMC-Scp complex subunit ScpB [Ignavibacterium album]MCX8105359.1 SMC-Scp complex subunit ScpB [Ignavibacterium album]